MKFHESNTYVEHRANAVYHEEVRADALVSDNETSNMDALDCDTVDDDDDDDDYGEEEEDEESDPEFQGDDQSDSGEFGRVQCTF